MADSSSRSSEFDVVGPRRFPAWGLSVLMHTGLLVALALLLRFTPQAPIGEGERTVGVALVRESEGERQYVASETAQESSAATAASQLQQALPEEVELNVDLSGALPSVESLSLESDGLSLPDLGSAGNKGSSEGRLTGQVTTSIFGVTGTGTKFVYVFDRSGSMEGYGGRPLASAKRELITSLNQLRETCQFQIIFYNERPEIFRSDTGAPRLVFGTETEKAKAIRFVTNINATGGTRHLDALRLALGMRPDVVFFLTDADEPRLSDRELQRVKRLNRSAMINSIEFGFGPQHDRNNFLTQLAKQNGGQHVYVDVRSLPDR